MLTCGKKKKIILAAIMFLAAGLFLAAPIFAQTDLGVDEVGGATGLSAGNGDLRVTIGRIIQYTLGFLGVVAIGIVLYAGFLYMTSGGSDEKTATARKWLINGAIGLAIIFSAFAITTYIISNLQKAITGETEMSASGEGPGGFLPSGFNNAFKITNISPSGNNYPVSSAVKITFSKPLDPKTINKDNIKIIKSGEKQFITKTIKPVEVSEANNAGELILPWLLEKGDIGKSLWTVCQVSPATMTVGNTPMTVKYDLSDYNYNDAESFKLAFDVKFSSSNPNTKMDVTCGDSAAGAEAFSVKKDFLPAAGENKLDIPKECYKNKDEVYLKFERKGAVCYKFDYLWLEAVMEDFSAASNNEIAGIFEVYGTNNDKVKFTPAADCVSAVCAGQKCFDKNSKFEIKIFPDKIKSNTGAYTLLCGAGEKCSASFTTSEICDADSPKVSFLAPAPNAKVSQNFDVDVNVNSVDTGGVNNISLFADGEFIESQEPSGEETPKDFTAPFTWGTYDLPVKKYTLKATSEDIDGHTGSAENIVSVLPEYCFDSDNNIKCDESGEHPECGACDGALCSNDDDCAGKCVKTCDDKVANSCEANSDCAAGVKCVGKCASLPVITGVKPESAAIGSFVTIYGSGFLKFDKDKSKVFFSGPNGTYLSAVLGCDNSTSWTGYQVVAKVPDGAVNGPVKIQNSSMEIDTTDDDDGWKGDFAIDSNIKYPGLCSVLRENCTPSCVGNVCAVCNQAEAGDLVKAIGENFGNKSGSDDFFFGDIKSLSGAGFSWTDKLIKGLQAPVLAPGNYNAAVGKGLGCQDKTTGAACTPPAENCLCGGVYSNPVQFKIITPANQPAIDAITPSSAPVGQMVTISGKYFGANVGYVEFSREIDGNPYIWPAGLGCGPENWGDNEIVVKVPENIKSVVQGLGKEVYGTDYKVIVYNAKGTASKPVNFEIVAGAPMPGICSVSPNNGPSGTKVNLTGEYFGSADNYEIKFSKTGGDKLDCPAGVTPCDPEKIKNCQCTKVVDPGVAVLKFSDWSDKAIQEVLVPASAVSGNVYLQKKSDKKKSNTVKFMVGSCKANSCEAGLICCGDGVCKDKCEEKYTYEPSQFMWMLSTGPLPIYPEVLERSCLVGAYPQSPSPYKDTVDACPNGLISATFNLPMSLSSFSNNIVIKRCLQEGIKCDFDKCGQKADCAIKTINAFDENDAAETNLSVKCTVKGAAAGKVCLPGEADCVCQSLTEGKITSFSLLKSLSKPENGLEPLIVQKINLGNDQFRYDLYKNTWYEVTIKGGSAGIMSADKSMQNDYKWSFATKTSACVPDSLLVLPIVGLIDDLYGQQKYVVSGMYQCQEIAMNNENWNWGIVKDSDKKKAKFAGYACTGLGDEGNLCQLGGGKSLDRQIGYFALNVDAGLAEKINFETPANQPVEIYAEAKPQADDIKKVFDKLYQKAYLDIEFKDPKVINYYPKCNDACVNAEIGADFNVEMDKASFTTDAVKLYSCFAGDCVNLTPVALAQNNLNYDYADNAVENKLVSRLKINAGDLETNKFYRVVLNKNINSASLVGLTGLNYRTENAPGGDCGDGLDNDGDNTADVSGGYNKSANEKKSLEYVCGCYDQQKKAFATYGEIKLPAICAGKTLTFGCIEKESDKGLISDEVVLAEIRKNNTYLSPDNQCASLSSFEVGASGQYDAFSWVFKTKNDPKKCDINNVKINPQKFISEKEGEKIEYWVEPYSSPDECNAAGQLLNAFNYDWTWASSDEAVAGISKNKTASAPKAYCGETCLTKGSTVYAAVCGNKKVETGEECDDGNIAPGDGCDPVCLHEPSKDICTPAEIADKKNNNCCGDGFTSAGEECDQGCVYKNSKNEACIPTSENVKDCVCQAKGTACTNTCLAVGTSQGFTCGNGIKEPGEDDDFGALNKVKGLDNKCLYVGAKYKVGDKEALAICGNGVLEAGEECEAIEGFIDKNPFCTKVCTWVGFTACKSLTDKNCCGNGILEDYPGGKGNGDPSLADEECEAVIFWTMKEAKNGKKVGDACAAGEDGCAAKTEFPAWCSNKCLNLGSSYKYNSYCGDGNLDSGEDEQCECSSSGGEECELGGVKGNPYQVAQIAKPIDLQNPSFVFDPETKYYKGLTDIGAVTSTANGEKDGYGELQYRTKTCPAENKNVGIDQAKSVPSAGGEVCRNALIYITLNNKVDFKNANITLNLVNDSGSCPAPANAGAGILDKFFAQAKRAFNFIFAEIGVAGAIDCPIEATVGVNENSTGQTIITVAPKTLLAPGEDYKIKINNLINLCGGDVAELTLPFKAGSDICLMDNVVVSPVEALVTEANHIGKFEAFAKSGKQLIAPMPGIYDWSWIWSNDNAVVVNSIQPDNAAVVDVKTGVKNGVAALKAKATVTVDKIAEQLGAAAGEKSSTVKVEKAGTSKITLFICDNPWSAAPGAGWQAETSLLNSGKYVSTYLFEKAYNVGLFYCRDFGAAGDLNDDLPKLKIVQEVATVGNCADGIDNDGDGKTDMIDALKYTKVANGTLPLGKGMLSGGAWSSQYLGTLFQYFVSYDSSENKVLYEYGSSVGPNNPKNKQVKITPDIETEVDFDFVKDKQGKLKILLHLIENNTKVQYMVGLKEDVADPDCSSANDYESAGECNDGKDNDFDGNIDLADKDCLSAADNSEDNLLVEYFLPREDDKTDPSYDHSADLISLRVFGNPEALSPSVWYQEHAPNPAPTTGVMNLDCQRDDFGEYCYAAAKDGVTVYAGASNLSGTNVYNNIYVLSYNQGANEATKNIYTQMINLLRFNFNLGSIDKKQLIRDTHRLNDMVNLRGYLDIYKDKYKSVPQMESGTYVRGRTFSVWPSWQGELSKALQQNLPQDPLNHWQWADATGTYNGANCGSLLNNEFNDALKCPFSGSSKKFQCVATGKCVQCPQGYDKATCYNSQEQKFNDIYTPELSPVYSYEVDKNDKTKAHLNYMYEVDGLNYVVSPDPK